MNQEGDRSQKHRQGRNSFDEEVRSHAALLLARCGTAFSLEGTAAPYGSINLISTRPLSLFSTFSTMIMSVLSRMPPAFGLYAITTITTCVFRAMAYRRPCIPAEA